MLTYESIETLYVRDSATNKLDWGKLRNPAWWSVDSWHLTEKIDGTNIRVIVNKAGVIVRGRRDTATVPGDLSKHLYETFDHQLIMNYFKAGKPGDLAEDWSVTFYGEGYGPGIKGSEPMQYRAKDKRFRCFDICYGEKFWADVYAWSIVCSDLGIDIAPMIGITQVPRDRAAAEDMLNNCGLSAVALLEGGSSTQQIEGVVARPAHPLFDVYGNRMIWKLTRREFDK